MNTRVATGLYLVAWIVLSAGIVFGLVHAGISIWAAAALVYLVFTFVNGTLAYRHLARKLAPQGLAPPPYLSYVFFGSRGPGPIRVSRPVRVLLALVVASGGVLFVVMAILLASKLPSPLVPSGVGVLAVLALFGCAFIYVGVRLAVVKDDEPLFKRSLFRGRHTDHGA
jgi:hypothetical protein